MEPPKEPNIDVKGVEENQPAAKEAPVQLTKKQKRKLAMKEKHKNKPKSKSAGQVRFYA
jgi:hypothetical protein